MIFSFLYLFSKELIIVDIENGFEIIVSKESFTKDQGVPDIPIMRLKSFWDVCILCAPLFPGELLRR